VAAHNRAGFLTLIEKPSKSSKLGRFNREVYPEGLHSFSVQNIIILNIFTMIDYYPKLEPNTCYHIYNRGNNRENLFCKEENYRYFLQKYAKYMSNVLDTYVYNLLPNHFHVVVRVKPKAEIVPVTQGKGVNTPSHRDGESLSEGEIVSELFRRFFMAYAKAINKQEGRIGSLFQKNFKRRPVESKSHFNNLIYYIHANAQLHGLCTDFKEWPHSSYVSILSDGHTLLLRNTVLGYFHSKTEFEAYHQQYVDLKNIERLMIEEE
jgi:putative transposase